MTASRISGVDFGAMVRQRREARDMDVDALCKAIGGTPSAGFLTSLEEGAVGATSSLVLKLATALALPADLLLNAAGFATQSQRAQALADLAGMSDEAAPRGV
ncbi:MAG: helix-turn-helix domain-containing protein [Candidatus Limnocylindria bacterium]